MPKMNGGDPAFKLFGRNIPVSHPQIPAPDTSRDTADKDAEPVLRQVNASGNGNESFSLEDMKKENKTSAKANHVEMSPNSKYDQPETNGTDQEKGFKKPDKVLTCPRCNSLDTKFCYFNNYNVNQPRHFCKNCQRYWTAGGTMRNVPIGAGRRKNKHLASQYRQIIVSSDGVPVTQIESMDSATQQLRPVGECANALIPPVGNGTVLKFGTEAPLCKSMETVLSLGEHKNSIEMNTNKCGERQEEPSSCVPAVTVPSEQVHDLPGNVVQKEQVGVPAPNGQNPQHALHCYPTPPWVFPWNPGLSSGAPNTNPNQVQWCPAPVVAVPGICPPNIPLQFVPASYWGCMPVWTAGAGNVSLAASNGCLSPSSSTSNSCCSGNGSPTLGKHTREANFVEEDQPEKTVLVPKTLRIDDPSEASRSPIWATLGIKPGQNGSAPGGKIFKAFKPKTEGKDHEPGGTHILEANPAALSRSHTFQEST